MNWLDKNADALLAWCSGAFFTLGLLTIVANSYGFAVICLLLSTFSFSIRGKEEA